VGCCLGRYYCRRLGCLLARAALASAFAPRPGLGQSARVCRQRIFVVQRLRNCVVSTLLLKRGRRGFELHLLGLCRRQRQRQN
jgi:hypothetical protein